MDNELDLTMLWHSGFWDGPMSGMASLNREYVWFDCTDMDLDDRAFTIYRLSDDDKIELVRQHRLFQQHVGHHCDHDPNVYQEYSGGNDPDKFYKLQKKFPKIDVKRGEVLLTAHWNQFKNWSRPK